MLVAFCAGVGIVVLVAFGCAVAYFSYAVAVEWLTDHFNFHLATRWTIGSETTGRSFSVRNWGISFVLRHNGPTRAVLYVKSDRK